MSTTELRSPWLENIHRTRPANRLDSDYATDIAVVGAGIAGVTTAYFILTRTWRTRVILIEADRVAHGATGHNAGQLVSYFERSFLNIVNEFGSALAGEGQHAVESAWELIEDMRRNLQLETPCQIFTGYAGCVDLDEIMTHMLDNEQRVVAGLQPETMLIADTFARRHAIPRRLRKLYTVVPHARILNLLQTKDASYVATLSSKKGCMNSARFCEEVIEKLTVKYAHRLRVVEHAPVRTVRLYRRHVELLSGRHTVTARRAVLCTNGFERFHIENNAGANIDVKFHHLVRGSVGYMAAFTEAPPAEPTAVSFIPSRLTAGGGAYGADPYFYLTRRPYERHDGSDLVCVGGPEALMDDTNNYSKAHPYPSEAKKMINSFIRRTYQHTGRRLQFTHLWHGLMGYTPNGIRCVGAEPCNPVLLYNLGCNGVGILPSIYGSFRISQILRNEKLSPSIFDPADMRCMLPEKKSVRGTAAQARRLSRRLVWGFIVVWCMMMVIVLVHSWTLIH